MHPAGPGGTIEISPTGGLPRIWIPAGRTHPPIMPARLPRAVPRIGEALPRPTINQRSMSDRMRSVRSWMTSRTTPHLTTPHPTTPHLTTRHLTTPRQRRSLGYGRPSAICALSHPRHLLPGGTPPICRMGRFQTGWLVLRGGCRRRCVNGWVMWLRRIVGGCGRGSPRVRRGCRGGAGSVWVRLLIRFGWLVPWWTCR